MVKNGIICSKFDLLRTFESDGGAAVAEGDVTAASNITESPQGVSMSSGSKSVRVNRKTSSEGKQAAVGKRRACNLYLAVEDIAYLNDLGKVIGSNPTQIVSKWVAGHRAEKGEQVQRAARALQANSGLL